MHQSYLRYKEFWFAKLALLLSLLCAIAYLIEDPVVDANGGTWLGYTLGTIAAILVLWLCAMGLRKRSFISSFGTVKAWTSAHVYLGCALWIVASLHSGFQLGWNIHSLTWLLMNFVIISGLWGVWSWWRYPKLMTADSNENSSEEILRSIHNIGERALRLADDIGTDTHQIVLRSIERSRIGGGFWQLLRTPKESLEKDDLEMSGALSESVVATSSQNTTPLPSESESTTMFMANQATSEKKKQQHSSLLHLSELMSERKRLIKHLNQQARYRAKMRVWLLVHVPLSVAFLATLIIHIISVFAYW